MEPSLPQRPFTVSSSNRSNKQLELRADQPCSLYLHPRPGVTIEQPPICQLFVDGEVPPHVVSIVCTGENVRSNGAIHYQLGTKHERRSWLAYIREITLPVLNHGIRMHVLLSNDGAAQQQWSHIDCLFTTHQPLQTKWDQFRFMRLSPARSLFTLPEVQQVKQACRTIMKDEDARHSFEDLLRRINAHRSTPHKLKQPRVQFEPTRRLSDLLTAFISETTLINAHMHDMYITATGSSVTDQTGRITCPAGWTEQIPRVKYDLCTVTWQCTDADCECVSERKAIITLGKTYWLAETELAEIPAAAVRFTDNTLTRYPIHNKIAQVDLEATRRQLLGG